MLPLYDNIRRRRIELDMSQQELAEKSGYTDRSSIAKIETGKVDLTQSKILAIAKALKIHPGALMGWTTKENQELWRYATIENDKMSLNLPGLSNDPYRSALLDSNSPLPFDISPNLFYFSLSSDPSSETQTWPVFNKNGIEGAHENELPSNDVLNEINKLVKALMPYPAKQVNALLKIVENGGNIPLNPNLPPELKELVSIAANLSEDSIKALIQVAKTMK